MKTYVVASSRNIFHNDLLQGYLTPTKASNLRAVGRINVTVRYTRDHDND